jgi:hypothetical protein
MMNRPFLTLNSSEAILFDGLAAVCWFVNMHSSVSSPRIRNMAPGQLYTFVFTQDAVGGHTMSWPGNCVNAAPIDPAPNATTVQSLIGDLGGILYANIAPTRNVP